MRFLRILPFILFNEAAGGAPTGAGASPTPPVTPPAAPVVAAPAPPAPAAAVAPAPPIAPPEKDPEWLNKRVAQAKTNAQAELLRTLGVTSLDDAKAAVAAAQAKADADKTIAQKAADAELALKAAREQNTALTASIATYATAQLATLTEPQKAAVTAIAGDDPAKQLTAIEALRPTWAVAPAPVAPAGTPPATPAGAAPATPAVPPTDTAPGQTAPKQNSTSPADPKAVYAEIKKTNPVVAARYALVHGIHNVTQT